MPISRLFFRAIITGILLKASFPVALYAQNRKAMIQIELTVLMNGKTVETGEAVYQNTFGESFTLRKLKFYLSHFMVTGVNTRSKAAIPYYLYNMHEPFPAIEFEAEPGQYDSLHFMMGLDSLAHCSGAQTGALDPMQDMFWTWNSGYVIFKLEGSSPQSTGDLNRIEHHIGGYKNNQQVSSPLAFATNLNLKAGETRTVNIIVQLDRYWDAGYPLRISENPLCTQAGTLAKNIAQNFPGMFRVDLQP